MIELPTVVDEFADHFDRMPIAYDGRPDYRVLVASGTLVAASAIVGQPLVDGSIDLLGIEIDLHWPDVQSE